MSIPRGNNVLNSLGIFTQRTLYKDKIYPDSLPIPIDLWYGKPLYGKLNSLDRAVFVSEAALKQIKVKEKKILMALNFVVDAFSDFRTFFERSKKQAKIDVNESEFEDVEPKVAWESVHSIYQSHVAVLFEVFRDTFVKEFSRDIKILDFNSFLKVFLEYIDILNPAYPFTRTAFITTKFCSMESTGLVIQLRNTNHAIDQKKYENFILDKNFEFYTKVARQHGFMIDKNAPWRLVADIASPAMVPYMEKYGISAKNLFGNFYYESQRTELDVLKVYVSEFYNSFVSAEPFVEITKQSATTRIITERLERKTIKPDQFDDLFWIKLHCYIRCRETGTSLSQGN